MQTHTPRTHAHTPMGAHTTQAAAHTQQRSQTYGVDGLVDNVRRRGAHGRTTTGEQEAVDVLKDLVHLLIGAIVRDGHHAAAGGLDPLDVARGDVLCAQEGFRG